MNHLKQYCLLGVVFLLAACQSTAPDQSHLPGPTQTEYATTLGAGFLVADEKAVLYAMTYRLHKSPGPNASYVVEFENPTRSKDLIFVKKRLSSINDDLLVRSRMFFEIQNNKSYTVTLKLFSDGKHVADHVQQVHFSIPEEAAKSMNLKVY